MGIHDCFDRVRVHNGLHDGRSIFSLCYERVLIIIPVLRILPRIQSGRECRELDWSFHGRHDLQECDLPERGHFYRGDDWLVPRRFAYLRTLSVGS